MTSLSAFDQLVGSCDRARAVREITDADVVSLLDRLLERGRVLGCVDERELLLLLVQRFDFALLDLQLADRYRRTPNLVEPVLEDRIREGARAILDEEPSADLVGILVRRTMTAAQRLDNIGTPRDDAVILEAAVGDNGQLRCAYCGYHFLETDVRPSLRNSVRLDDMEFAKSIHHRRGADAWKPVRSKTTRGDIQSWTELQIEHRVPDAALGENTRENLTVACKWCNRGKRAYQSYAEALPSLLAVSLGKLHLPWALDHVARAFYTVVNREGSCAKCSAQATHRELTVEGNAAPAGLRRPFEVRTACYECRDPT
jgi:5-methylcytosine-specific restriction endonuclease McrA